MHISSDAFKDGGNIPAVYSCEGKEISPPLTVTAVPAAAKSLAVIVHDQDAEHAGGFTHWVVWNIPAGPCTIPENFKGGEQGLNGSRAHGYKGMCPPSGIHHYHFKLYAIDKLLNISEDADKAMPEDAVKYHVVAEAALIGLYQKLSDHI